MKKIYSILLCIGLVAGFVACEKDKEFALTTLSINNEVITPAYNSADVRCSFKTDATISDAYVQYALSSSFAKYEVAKMTEEKGIYAAQLVGLADNTMYYIRYEVSNKYSSVVTEEVKEFQTLQCTVPTIVLDTIGEVRASHAKVQIHLTFDGGASVTDMGVCWSTHVNPTTKDIHISTEDTLAVLDVTSLQPNTKYYVRAYAQNKVGVAYSEEKAFTTESILSEPTGTENGYAYVDLGLSVKWATMNVGANSPEDSGDYFAWGETEPQYSYYWNTYKYCNGSETTLTKYNSNEHSGTVDNKITLELIDDAAHVNWEGNWRMPTAAEWTELREQCTWTWTSKNGVKGHKVTSKGNGNSIFLPAAGRRFVEELVGVGVDGNYWSNTLNVASPCEAMYLLFISSGAGNFGTDRYSGYSVRPVFGEKVVESTIATVTTSAVSQITETTAVAGGNVTADGNASVTERGVCIATISNPTVANTKITAGNGVGAFTCELTGLQEGMKYYVRAYAVNSMGTAYGEEKEFTTSTKPKYVDLGLPSGVKWATFNVGANSPEESGDYYAWGETSPKSSYTWLNYKWCEGSYNMLTKYNCDSSKGVVDYKTILDPEDDAATVNWGQGWRIPTKAEFDELIDNCTWTWSSINGVYGYEVKSNTNGNSIFLPSVGYYNDNTFQTYSSRYRSSSLGVNTPPYFLNFNASYIQIIFQGNQSDGYAIRPVSGDYAPDVPTVITSNVIEITNTSVSVVCEIIRDGGLPIIECGVSYVEGTTTPIEWEKKIIAENNSTEYICHITGLKANTSYRVRAYAVNSKGTAYGSPVTFTTKEQSSTEPGVTETITVNGVSFKMVTVEGGTFTMGATSEQGSDANGDESPTHSVTLSDFAIGETEVTQELWKAVMGSNPSSFSGTNLPVENVSWHDCQTFISKLNNLTGKNFRLPTEAEWEYAARGGQKSQGYKYAGSNTLGDVAWYDENSSSKTHPVKQKQANELGLYDMSGNVHEWCQDLYGGYSSNAQTNPTGPTSGSHRVIRGGSWYYFARFCRVSNRYICTPTLSSDYGLGLRLAL